ncbi:MAG: hypothetical protein ACR2H4_01875 [Pyrinomonadaceae bacterium]
MLLTKSLLALSLLAAVSYLSMFGPPAALLESLQADLKIETSHDARKNKTTVRLAPVQISEDNGKYRSLHMAPAFSYTGKESRTPEIIDFELRTVVRGQLETDLYVVFVIDGEKVFLSSNRSAIKRPVPGRVWLGERLVFRMPYETFVKITKAKALEIRVDDVRVALSEEHLRTLRAFGDHIPSDPNPH